MLGKRRRRWANKKTTLVQSLVFVHDAQMVVQSNRRICSIVKPSRWAPEIKVKLVIRESILKLFLADSV